MTLKDLTYITAIVEEGGISQAAKKLFLSQPSLSQTVHRIEESLGVPLFRRTPKGLVLTESGEEYYKMASRILKIYQNFEEDVRDIHDLKRGKVELGITTHRGLFLLPEFLADFHIRYPAISVHITEAATNQLEHLLLCGKIDLAITRAPATEQGNRNISYEGLLRDSFLILLPPGHPLEKKAVSMPGSPYPALDLSLLSGETFLLPAESMRLRETVDQILKRGGIGNPKTAFTSIYAETLVRLVAAGQGVSILPENLSAPAGLDPVPRYFSIPEEYGANWESCIATLSDAYLSRASSTFIEEFRKFLAA